MKLLEENTGGKLLDVDIFEIIPKVPVITENKQIEPST